ncbi:hypothetical protein RHS01_08673 [Rhizoctonia solani]|uniref:Tc1-like transposase DDE domain-containing protein n=1 Tax=Rhizoctonia solani TaxID=456999 RepID=A0A8H7M1N4_9AGAM|nr:hypothetical protein RHS01_08673 [Rhizoctonia solani]
MPPSKTKLQKKRQIGIARRVVYSILMPIGRVQACLRSPLWMTPSANANANASASGCCPAIELLCPPTPGHKEIEPGPSENNRAPTVEEAKLALWWVVDAIRTPNPRVVTPTMTLTTPRGKHFIAESLRAAVAQGKNATYARSIRQWIRTLITTGDLPYFHHGWWNVPMLGDEDIGHEIKTHLQAIGKYACAEAIVQFFSDKETCTRLGVPKAICLRMAQRWMTKYGGFRWRTELKGQYIDGHEQADIVEYREKTYVTFMKAIERLTTIYNEHGVPDPERPILIFPGEKPIIVWFHDESTFFANDRQIVRSGGYGEKWESARVILRPGINRDGWFTSTCVVKQLEDAVKIVQEAISARSMPKGEVKVFPRPVTVNRGNGTTEKVIPPRMEPGQLLDGTLQSFYLPDDHEDVNRRGAFKGMAQILRERGLYEAAEKKAECPGFNQPDFESRDSNLEEAARKLETRVIFLPKYHCELNPIEQCWGYAKRKYRQKPPTNNENMMKKYVIEALESIPIDTIRKFVARSQRFVDAYASGNNGEMAIEWATKAFRSHRQTPGHIPYKQIALGYVHTQDNAYIG